MGSTIQDINQMILQVSMYFKTISCCDHHGHLMVLYHHHKTGKGGDGKINIEINTGLGLESVVRLPSVKNFMEADTILFRYC